ncbi:MAG: hypothetical protein WBZ33_03225, partial [Thermoactinomyces sp.]
LSDTLILLHFQKVCQPPTLPKTRGVDRLLDDLFPCEGQMVPNLSIASSNPNKKEASNRLSEPRKFILNTLGTPKMK